MKVLLNRVLAFLYDIIIHLILLLILTISVNFLADRFDLNTWQKQLTLWSTSIFLFILFYAVLPIKTKGTFGKVFTDLQVVPTNGKMTFGRWLFRELVCKYFYPYTGVIAYFYLVKKIAWRQLSIILGIYFGIGLIVQLFFIIIKRKPMHDALLRTTVVAKEKN